LNSQTYKATTEALAALCVLLGDRPALLAAYQSLTTKPIWDKVSIDDLASSIPLNVDQSTRVPKSCSEFVPAFLCQPPP
jgi:hypothetical protein